MKLTKNLLIQLIEEAMEHGGLSCNEVHPDHTHNEWEDHKKEEEEVTKSMAKISIKPNKKLAEGAPVYHDEPYVSPYAHVQSKPERKGLAKYAEDNVPKDQLRDILKSWNSPEYEEMNDEQRWQEYGKDIQELVGDKLEEG